MCDTNHLYLRLQVTFILALFLTSLLGNTLCPSNNPHQKIKCNRKNVKREATHRSFNTHPFTRKLANHIQRYRNVECAILLKDDVSTCLKLWHKRSFLACTNTHQCYRHFAKKNVPTPSLLVTEHHAFTSRKALSRSRCPPGGMELQIRQLCLFTVTVM
jgi:hypothetical protein